VLGRLILIALVVVGAGCGKKPTPIAELTKAEGAVERQASGGAWAAAAISTRFFLGDAAQTADKPAELAIVGGNAHIAMRAHTILRFGGKPGAAKISVEAGAIDLSGTGSYTLDFGDVRLSRNGTIRVTSTGPGKNTVELTVGEAQVSTLAGDTIDLVLNQSVDVGDIKVTALVDAGVPLDAPAIVAVDAGVDPTAPAIEVTGKRAEQQLAGEKKWKPLAAGASPIVPNSKIRLGSGTTAKLTSGGTTLQLAGGSRLAVREDLGIAIETGTVTAAASGDAQVALPGGAMALRGTPTALAEARLDVGGQTKVRVEKGAGKLTGAPGTALEMARGESASLTKGGLIRVIDAIPSYFDFRITAGESLTIHDPRPPTALQFQFGGKCAGGGIIELDKDARFRTAKISAGKEAANVSISSGGWHYRLRCTTNGNEGPAVASGRVAVTRDDGRRALPKLPPSNPIEADGRTWTVSYQSVIPTLVISMKGTGSKFRLHLAQGGNDQTFDASKPSVTVPGSRLKEGTYTYWFDRDGVKQDKISTLKIDFDQTAPQVYIESPANGRAWSGDLDVRGAVLPGWTAAVDGITIPIDGQRRFSAKVGTPAGTALAIKLSHPQRGVHYYLRRAK
jgi:hypothetical protein